MKETTQSSSLKLKMLIIGLACACPLASQAVAPWLPGQLVVTATMTDVPSSNYNPRIVDGYNYVANTSAGTFTWARYAAGSSTAATTSSGIDRDQRMVSPLGGPGNSTYVLGSGGTTNLFTRYDWATGTLQASQATPATSVVAGATNEAYAWVDSGTIVANNYNPSANRNRLYLMNVVADPFALTLNTTNTGFGNVGYKDTTPGLRIRSVTVGSNSGVSNGYAYYGNGVGNPANIDPKFYALNLSTGIETELGSFGSLIPATSYAGIWTVVAQDGYLYVQTTNDGIKVFAMPSPTSIGSLYTTYTQTQLNALTGVQSYFGFDVNLIGAAPRMVLSGGGASWELSAAIPEPTALALLGLGLLVTVRRSRKS